MWTDRRRGSANGRCRGYSGQGRAYTQQHGNRDGESGGHFQGKTPFLAPRATNTLHSTRKSHDYKWKYETSRRQRGLHCWGRPKL